MDSRLAFPEGSTMRKISSSSTFFYKRILPICWFGIVALVTCTAIPEVVAGRAPIFVLLIPVGMMAFGYFLMRALVFDLVDEVNFDGKEFVVRNAGAEERIALSNVINVDFGELTNPERITLTLREPCKFGKQDNFFATI